MTKEGKQMKLLSRQSYPRSQLPEEIFTLNLMWKIESHPLPKKQGGNFSLL